MDIKIRKSTENDLPEILRLYSQPDLDNNKVLSVEDAKKIFEKISVYPSYTIFVALLENKIVGTFALLIMDNLAHMGSPSGIVEDVAVDPLHQNQGIGKAMMNFAFKICEESGCYKLVLSSNIKRKNAHKFYESLGFKQHGISFAIDIKGKII